MLAVSMSIISQIPALSATTVSDFVSGLIVAAARGVKVFISASVYNKLRPMFEELGIRVREVKGNIPADTYILIKSAGGIRIRIEVYEGGKRVNSISTTIRALEKALSEYIEKKKGGDSGEGPSFYELILPSELAIEGEEGDNEL